jgi:hypothetical protein
MVMMIAVTIRMRISPANAKTSLVQPLTCTNVPTTVASTSDGSVMGKTIVELERTNRKNTAISSQPACPTQHNVQTVFDAFLRLGSAIMIRTAKMDSMNKTARMNSVDRTSSCVETYAASATNTSATATSTVVTVLTRKTATTHATIRLILFARIVNDASRFIIYAMEKIIVETTTIRMRLTVLRCFSVTIKNTGFSVRTVCALQTF